MKNWKGITGTIIVGAVSATLVWASSTIRQVPVLESRINSQDARLVSQEGMIKSIDDKTTKILLLLASKKSACE